MNTSLSIKEAEKFEITAFKKPKNVKLLKESHVAFSGSPRKHPYTPYKVILVVDPFSGNTFYYEFDIDDIAFVEELANLVTVDDEVLPMARVWVRKNSIATRCTPFVVADTFK
jgi:hypothetical protein